MNRICVALALMIVFLTGTISTAQNQERPPKLTEEEAVALILTKDSFEPLATGFYLVVYVTPLTFPGDSQERHWLVLRYVDFTKCVVEEEPIIHWIYENGQESKLSEMWTLTEDAGIDLMITIHPEMDSPFIVTPDIYGHFQTTDCSTVSPPPIV